MATGAVIARIISQYSDKGTKAAEKDLLKMGKQYDQMASKVSRAFTVAAAASALFAVKIGTDAVKAAIADQKSQALLANSLRNTVGANTELLESVEAYILKASLATGVTDEQLRPSLSILATATMDVAVAQNLQALALDIAANRSKDLSSVSIALSRAYTGNFTALKRLGIPLSENLIKSKDFIGITKELAAVTSGAAATAADTLAGRLARMRIGYDEIVESLGYALLPVVQKFAEYVTTTMLPAIQNWVNLNKDQLAKGLQNTVDVLTRVGKVAIAFTTWAVTNRPLLIGIASTFATMFVVGKVAGFIVALGTIKAGLIALRTVAMGTAIATAFATGGVSIATAATALAVVGVTAFATKRAFDAMSGSTNKVTTAINGVTASTSKDFMARTKVVKVVRDQNTGLGDQAKLVVKLTAAQIASNKALANLKSEFNVNPISEKDPTQLEAVRLNLIKQQHLGLTAVTDSILAALEAQMRGNTAAQRYVDIMAVMKDNKITTSEIDNLADKWGKSTSFVKNYIAQVIGLDSVTLNKDFGLNFADSWNTATAAYKKYLAAIAAGSGATVVVPTVTPAPIVIVPVVPVVPVVPKPTSPAIPGEFSRGGTVGSFPNYSSPAIPGEFLRGGSGSTTQSVTVNINAGTVANPQELVSLIQDAVIRLNKQGDRITTAGIL